MDPSTSDDSVFGLIAGGVSAVFMIFGGAIPYLPQYKDIIKTKNAEGFSTHVCLVLTVANILRIMFWFGVHFETPLLLQSFVMIMTMLLMLQLCVETKHRASNEKNRHFSLTDFSHFWAWSEFSDYIKALLVFTLISGCITSLFIRVSWFVEMLGFAALLMEAMLAMPQFLKNFRTKSTRGMSMQMVGLWLSGDLFKTGYFMFNNAPMQFITCGFLQISIDLAIISQVFIYSKSSNYVKLQAN